jgi:hypothetical protein
MINMDELLRTLNTLSPAQKKQVIDFLQQPQPENGSEEPARQGLILNMHPGAMVMSPDFDDELPDEFWLGKDA